MDATSEGPLWVVSVPDSTTRAALRKLMTLPQDAADQTARRDLLSVLQSASKFEGGGVGTFGVQTNFLTSPYGTDYRNLCREDRVTLTYEMTGYDSWAGTHRVEKLQPRGVQAQPLFHVERLPVVDRDTGDHTVCTERHLGENASWFAADDALNAARAANIFGMAEDELKTGALKPAPCNSDSGDELGPDACRQSLILLDDVSKFERVESCQNPLPVVALNETACYHIWFSEVTVTVVAKMSAAGDYQIAPDSIQSIRAVPISAVVGE